MSSAAGPLAPDTPGVLTPKPIETPTHGLGGAGSFTVGCSTIVAAAPLICLDIVLDSSKYPEWNRFCRKCTIDSQPTTQQQQQRRQSQQQDDSSPTRERTSSPVLPDLGPEYLQLGTKFTFDVHMNPLDQAGSAGRAAQLEVSVLEPINEVVPAAGAPSPNSNSSHSRRSSAYSAISVPVSEGAAPADVAGAHKRYTRRTGWRIAWKMQTNPLLPSWMLRSERVQEFVELDAAPFGPRDEPRTEYTCWETFYGILAPVVRLSVGSQLVKGFSVWMEDLKKRAEEVERREGAFAAIST